MKVFIRLLGCGGGSTKETETKGNTQKVTFSELDSTVIGVEES